MDEPKPPRMGYEDKAAASHVSLGEDLWELHSAAEKIVEFTAGRAPEDFERLDVLRAAVASMLRLMHATVVRIQKQSPEIASRLEQTALLQRLAERLDTAPPEQIHMALWEFVEDSLPALLASSAEELAAWHDA